MIDGVRRRVGWGGGRGITKQGIGTPGVALPRDRPLETKVANEGLPPPPGTWESYLIDQKLGIRFGPTSKRLKLLSKNIRWVRSIRRGWMF